MNTATLYRPYKVAAKPAQRLLTAADLEMFPDELPSGPIKYELHKGRLVIMAPPGDIHGFRQSRILRFLHQAEDLELGEARSEIMIVLRRDPYTICAPDAAFILNASLPVRRSKEGYLETIPEIVVEVRSKNDTKREIQAKVELYLEAGVKEAWVLDSAAKTVAVNKADGNVQVFRDEEILTTGLLPGFTAPLVQLFAGD
jgi:Uma2 family endonuclease